MRTAKIRFIYTYKYHMYTICIMYIFVYIYKNNIYLKNAKHFNFFKNVLLYFNKTSYTYRTSQLCNKKYILS